MVGRIAPASHQIGLLGPVDELNSTVMPEQQRGGNVGQRRWPVRVSANCEKELVLRGGELFPCRLFLAPMQEAAQLGAECEQLLVVAI